jgi:hypothetical protein
MSRTILNFQAITLHPQPRNPPDSMLAGVLSRLVEATAVQGGAVYLLDEEERRLNLACLENGEHYPPSLPIDGIEQSQLEPVARPGPG